MNQSTEKENISFDASGKSLGRLASKIAHKLQGKHRVDYQKSQVADVNITVENASSMDISDDKLDNKTYDHHSGHPGGRKVQTARTVAEKKGFGELLRRAVLGMLPKNKLQKKVMKRLEIHE